MPPDTVSSLPSPLPLIVTVVCRPSLLMLTTLNCLTVILPAAGFSLLLLTEISAVLIVDTAARRAGTDDTASAAASTGTSARAFILRPAPLFCLYIMVIRF